MTSIRSNMYVRRRLNSPSRGFTIVELLVVIVVIGILAAITIVAYNGFQQRASKAVVQSDIHNALKNMQLSRVEGGATLSTANFLPSSKYPLTVDSRNYLYFSACVNPSGSYAIAAQTKLGDVYVSENGTSVVKNNSVNVLTPCAALGISNAKTVFAGMPAVACEGESGSCTYHYKISPGFSATPCANEGGACTFSGVKSVSFGSTATGGFIAISNVSSPVTCSTSFFNDDPAQGQSKACYVTDAGATTIDGSIAPTSCAKDGEKCYFSESRTIAYGDITIGDFTAKNALTSPVLCKTSTFGSDPLPGVSKSCYVLN